MNTTNMFSSGLLLEFNSTAYDTFRKYAVKWFALAILASPALAGSGNFNPYLVTRQGAGSDVFTAATTGTSFGTVSSGTTWLLEGGEISSWADGGDSANGANLWYSVYRDSQSRPNFTSTTLFFNSQSGNDKKWQSTGLGLDLTGSTVQILGATYNGTYNLDYYYQAVFNWGSQYNSAAGSGSTTVPSSNFYTASYTLTGFDYYLDQASSSASQSAASGGAAQLTGSVGIGKFGNGTVTMTNTANDYTGRTLVAAGTLQTTAAGVIPDGSDVYIKSGGVLDLNGNNETVASVREYGTDDGGTISLGAGTLTVNGSNKGNIFQNSISGTGGLTLSGSGTTLSLYGTQSYSGATTVSAGTLELRSANSSTSYTLSGGNLTTTSSGSIADSATVNITSSGSTFTVGANDTIGSFSGTAGTLSIQSGATLTAGTNANTTFSGVISGSGALIKNGSGSLTLDGNSANTYSGTTTVNAGVLILNKNGTNALAGTPTINNGGVIRLGAGNQFSGDTTFLTVNSGGVFDMNGFNETLALQGTGTVTLGGGTMTINPGNTNNGDSFTGVIAGSTGNVIKTNVGIQTLGGNNTYNGATTVGQGVLRITSANALGSTNGATTVGSGAALQLSNATSMTVAENMTLNGTGVSGAGGALRNTAGANTVSGTVTLGSNARIAATGGSLSVGGNIGGGNNVLFVGAEENVAISGAISGAGNSQDGTTTSLFKDGAKTLTLSGNNSYSGDTRVVQGVLTVASGGNLGDGTSDVFIAQSTNTAVLNINSASEVGNVIISGNGTLNVNANTEVASISEVGTGNGGTASIGAGATLTVSGDSYATFQNSISGEGALTKSGTGTLALYGTQGYTGKTTVSGGVLKTQNDIVSFASTNIEVTGGTFQTQSANVLSDSATATINGGTITLGGNDTVGSFSISGGTLGGSATLTAATYALNGGNINAVLGAGDITVGGGTNTLGSAGRLNSGSSLTLNSGELSLGGNETVASLAGSGGTLKLGANSLTLGGNSYSNSFAGVISGAGSLIKNGSGTLSLSGVNTYEGGTFLNGGTLDADNSSAFGTGSVTVAATTTLDLLSHNITNLIINNGGTILSTGTVSDVVASNGTTSIGGADSVVVEASGSATVDVSGSNVTVSNVSGTAAVNVGGTGATIDTVSGGTVTLSNTATGSTVNTASAGTVNAAAANVNVGTVSGTAAVNVAGTNAQVTTVSGGTVTLSNTATGSRVNTASAGTVNANAAGVSFGTISNTATVNVGGNNGRVTTLAGGTLNANAAGLVVTNFNGGNMAVDIGLTVAIRGGNSSGVISGPGAIAKQGPSTLTLSGNNTYSGATTVVGGKLIVNGSITNSDVTVQSGAVLGGSGSVGDTVILSGATIAPGNSPGIQSIVGDLTWSGGGSYDWEIFNYSGSAGTDWDLITVSDQLLFSNISALNPFTINLISLSALPNTQGSLAGWNPLLTNSWTILSTTNGVVGFDASYFTLNLGSFTNNNSLGTGLFSLASDGSNLNLLFDPNGGGPGPQPVPEPGTWAAAALLAGAAGYVRWRRRNEQPKKA